MKVLQILGASLGLSLVFACGVYGVVCAWEHDLLPRFAEHSVERHPKLFAEDLAGSYGGELVLASGSRFRQGVRVVFCGFGDPEGPGDIDRWIEGSWRVEQNFVVLDPHGTNEVGSRLEAVRIDGEVGLVVNAGPRQRILLRD